MLKAFLSLLFFALGHPVLAQVQTLAEYNRSLFSRLTESKSLSANEFKTLRIRLGAEVASADDRFYKEGELLKLMNYATLSTYISQNKAHTKLIKKMWDQFLALPNPATRSFEVEYLIDISKAKDKSPLYFLNLSDYLLSLVPKNEPKRFFLTLVTSKCEVLTYLRKTEELKKCWDLDEDFSDNDLRSQVRVRLAQLLYYHASPVFKKDFDSLVAEILVDKKLESLHLLAKRFATLVRIAEGDTSNLDQYVEELKRDRSNSSMNVGMIFWIYLVQNQLDKAKQFFKSVIERNLSPSKLLSFYRLSAELFFRTGELQKSTFYLNKIMAMKLKPLDELSPQLAKLAISILSGASQNLTEIKKSYDEYPKILSDYGVDDPEYRLSVKIGQILLKYPSIDLTELNEAFNEYKNFLYPNELNLLIVKKLITELSEKQKSAAVDNTTAE